MSAFNNLIEQVALKEKLVKVQLKTDPAFSNLGNISKFQGYIGYILRENGSSSKVFLEQNGAVIIVPNKMIEPVQNKLSKVDRFKLAALRYLKEKRDIKQTDILTKLIINCNSIEYVESFCIDNGCTQNDIKNIYKIAFNSTINESWWDIAKGAANAAAKVGMGRDPFKPWIDKENKTDTDKYHIPGKIAEFIENTRRNPITGNAIVTDGNMYNDMLDEINNVCEPQDITRFKDEYNKITPGKITNNQLISLFVHAINHLR